MAHDAISVERLDENIEAHAGHDPLGVRWGINTIVREKYFDGRRYKNTSETPFIPYGKWFPITRFQTPEEIHSVDEEMAREQMVTKTALSAQLYLEEMLAGVNEHGIVDPRKRNFGLKIDFYGEKDPAKMAVVSRTLLPSLTEIREICRKHDLDCPISDKCEAQDDLDFTDRETCATCWFKWIDSDACSVYISIVAEQGLYVNPDNPKLIKPDVKDLLKARQVTAISLQTGIVALQKEWSNMIGEIEKGERKGFDEAGYQHGIRKDIHETKPQDRQTKLMREYGEAVNKGSDNSDVIAMLAQSQIQTNQLLQRLLEKDEPKKMTPQEALAKAREVKAQKQQGE